MRLRGLAVVGLVFVLCIPCLAAETVSARGVVVDPEGNPVSGVKVYAVVGVIADDTVTIGNPAVSGEDGRFEMISLPRPRTELGYELVAFKPGEYLGWARGVGELRGRQGGEPEPAGDYRITVSKPDIFEGRVVDEAGNGIPGAEVVPVLVYDGSGPLDSAGPEVPAIPVEMLKVIASVPPATTDAEGVFRLAGVPLHAQALCYARKSGHAMNTREIGRGDPKRLVLVPAGSVAGSLVDRQGKGLSGITMRAEANNYGPGRGEAKTAKDGSYAVDNLLPGSYYVMAVGLNDTVASPIPDILVKVGETAKAPKMIATPGVLLQVRVVDADSGKPIARGSVTTYMLALSQATYKTSKVDGLGRCTVRVAPGKYHVYFRGEAAPYKYDRIEAVTVTIPNVARKDLALKVKKAEIARGRVIRAGGTPLIGASVSIGGDPTTKTITDANGRFTAMVPPAKPKTPG